MADLRDIAFRAAQRLDMAATAAALAMDKAPTNEDEAQRRLRHAKEWAQQALSILAETETQMEESGNG